MIDLDQFVEVAFVVFMFGLPMLLVIGMLVAAIVTGIGAIIEWFDKRLERLR